MYCLWTARFGHILLHYFVLHLWIINTAAGADVKVNRVRFCTDRCETLFGLEVVAWATNAGLNKRSVTNAGYNAGNEKDHCGGLNIRLSHRDTGLTTFTSSGLLSYTALCTVSGSEIKAQLEFLCLQFLKWKLHIIFYDFDSDLLNRVHLLIFRESI